MSTVGLAAREPLLFGAPAPVLAGGAAALAGATAVVETVLDRAQITSWPLETAALVALAAAGALVVLRANPFRAPFRRRSHALVLTLVLLAFALDELAQVGRNLVVHDDWGLAVVPVFLLVLAMLRPPRELLVGGLGAAAVVVATVLLAPASLPVGMLPAAGAAIALTQVLPPALAAAALARRTIRGLGPWRTTAAVRPGAAAVLSAQQEAIARLEAAAIPLLSTVVASGSVSGDQADRARAILVELRAALVADLARGWLAEAGFGVDDPDGYAERMTVEQRTALRTTVASLPLADFEHPGTASVRGQDREATLTLVLPVSTRPRRTRVAPQVPLLRTSFPRADVRIGDERVLVRVDFGIPR
jgi:hypothetical protein